MPNHHRSATASIRCAERREDLLPVLGEQHRRTSRARRAPLWLAIPERGLYTGLPVVDTIGSGKTSAGIHPCIDQLVAYHAYDPVRKAANLVDFC
jgi:hypothetical protein